MCPISGCTLIPKSQGFLGARFSLVSSNPQSLSAVSANFGNMQLVPQSQTTLWSCIIAVNSTPKKLRLSAVW